MSETQTETCMECDGTGQVCSECLEADGQCTCNDGPDLMDCEACDGCGDIDVEDEE